MNILTPNTTINNIDWKSLAITMLPASALLGAVVATSPDPLIQYTIVGYALAALPVGTMVTGNPVWLIPSIAFTGLFVTINVGSAFNLINLRR
jgi:hypothetical protein